MKYRLLGKRRSLKRSVASKRRAAFIKRLNRRFRQALLKRRQQRNKKSPTSCLARQAKNRRIIRKLRLINRKGNNRRRIIRRLSKIAKKMARKQLKKHNIPQRRRHSLLIKRLLNYRKNLSKYWLNQSKRALALRKTMRIRLTRLIRKYLSKRRALKSKGKSQRRAPVKAKKSQKPQKHREHIKRRHNLVRRSLHKHAKHTPRSRRNHKFKRVFGRKFSKIVKKTLKINKKANGKTVLKLKPKAKGKNHHHDINKLTLKNVRSFFHNYLRRVERLFNFNPSAYCGKFYRKFQILKSKGKKLLAKVYFHLYHLCKRRRFHSLL